MRALFLSLPLHGHTNPTLPLVRELTARGEDIVYYSAAAFGKKIEQAGAVYRPYANSFLSDMKQLPERMEELPWLLTRTTGELLDHELDDFRALRPDYIITDSVAPWGHWVGEALGVPVVTSVATCAFNRRVVTYGMAHGVRPSSGSSFFSKLRYVFKALLLARRLRHKHGLAGPALLESACGSSGLTIVYTSRYFQPCADSFDDRFLFAGPSAGRESEGDGFDWSRLQGPVVIYVSLGTLFNKDAAFYRNCFEAFRGEAFQVILSVGGNVPVAELGSAPPNFIVETHVPQLEVLARAAAFLTHGGMNSVSESLWNGVPVVVIPHVGEQQVIGRRVEELAAGLYLSKRDATPENLRTAVRRLLTEDRFRQQAAAVRVSFEAAGGVSRAADAILKYTRQ